MGTISKPEELLGKRVVTSFPNLTRKYFEGLKKDHGTKIRCVQPRPVAPRLALAPRSHTLTSPPPS